MTEIKGIGGVESDRAVESAGVDQEAMDGVKDFLEARDAQPRKPATCEYDRIMEAKEFLAKLIKVFVPEVGITLGSGLGDLVRQIEIVAEVSYEAIPHFPGIELAKVDGHRCVLVFGYLNGVRVVVMDGRRHPYEGVTLKEAVFGPRLMTFMGAKKLLFSHAVGAMTWNYLPGEFVAIYDHIALHHDSPLMGENDPRLGTRFPDMGEVYSRRFIELAMECALEVGVHLHRGVSYLHLGPEYETPAEIRQMNRDGADVCTMSTVYEAIAARHRDAEVLDIAMVVNMAAGLANGKLTHGEVMERVKQSMPGFIRLITAAVKKMAEVDGRVDGLQTVIGRRYGDK